MNTVLRDWLDAIASSAEQGGFKDVHVDQLGRQYKPLVGWIKGTVQLLLEATEYVQEIGLRGTIAAAFALASADWRIGVNYKTSRDLKGQLDDMTPPSLYYFPDVLPWHSEEWDYQEVPIANFPIDLSKWSLLQMEHRREGDPAYGRTLWVIPIASRPGVEV